MTNKTLYIVATPIGNLKDFSSRAIDTLNSCDLILCEDTRVSLKLLSTFNIKKPLKKYEKFSENEVSQNIDKLFLENNNIALITDAGTPCISDPGAILVKKARESGYRIYSIPGCSAVIYAMSVSGFDNNNFAFLGFLSRKDNEQRLFFKNLEKNSEYLNCFVFYESPNRILSTLKNLSTINVNNVCVVNDATKLFEKHYVGSLESVIEEISNNEKSNKGEYVVVFNIKPLEKKEDNNLTKEALIVNEMIMKKITSKDAIKILSKSYNRDELYLAGLNLKNILKK